MSTIEKFNLDGRVAVVTGGTGLLGRAFCQTLAGAGAHVVIADIEAQEAANLAARLTDAGGSARSVMADVTQPDSVKNMVEVALQAFGRLDILVNNAALVPKFEPTHRDQHVQTFERYPLDAWNRALEIDLTGPFLCAQAVAGPMVEAGRGAIINLSSIYGLVGPDQRIYQRPGEPPQYKPVTYSVTKAGILGLTRYLATYFAGKNIRVNALTPGGVFNEHDEGFVRAYSARAVLGRMAQVDELQGALLFLASDASAYMTGANLVVDGGWTAW